MSTMLGMPTEEYEEIAERLLSRRADPASRGGRRYMVDSLGRLWSDKSDGTGIYLVNDVTQIDPLNGERGQNGLWRAAAA